MKQQEMPVIKASEISNYKYCSVAWYLSREGHGPKAVSIKSGVTAHKDMGLKIETVREIETFSRKLTFLAFLLIVISIILIFLGGP